MKILVLFVLISTICIRQTLCDEEKGTTKKHANVTEITHQTESHSTRATQEIDGKEDTHAEKLQKAESGGKKIEIMDCEGAEEKEDESLTVAALNYCEVRHPLTITAFIVALVIVMIGR